MIYLSKREAHAIVKIVDYLYDDEEKHYDELRLSGEDVKGHIFNDVKILKRLSNVIQGKQP